MLSSDELALLCAVLVSAAAALSDWRSGTIPNWLTIPPLLVAPIAYGTLVGPGHAVKSIAAAALSGAVPYLLFRRRAMGGGDVKLFAALGAIAGFAPLFGLRVQWMAFIAAMVPALCILVRQGRLGLTLRTALGVLTGSVSQTEQSLHCATPIRLGGAVLAATVIQALPFFSFSGGRP